MIVVDTLIVRLIIMKFIFPVSLGLFSSIIDYFSVILSPFLALLLRHRHTALEKKSTLDKTRNALQYSLSDDPHFVCLL